MSDARLAGTAAENLAAAYLRNKGYTIITRRQKTRSGELDLIALDGEILVFVEVKMSTQSHMTAQEAVTAQKKARLLKAADEYVMEFGNDTRHCRLDLITVYGQEVRHWVDAFDGQ